MIHPFLRTMIKKIKPSPFVANVLSTTGASVLTLTANIFILRFLAEGFGTERFGAYSLAGRFMALLFPFSTLELGTAMSRFTSLSRNEASRRAYLLSGLLLGLVPNFLILTGGILFARPLTLLIFHHARYQTLFFMTLFWVVAFFFFAVLDGFYFGSGRIRKANLWEVFLGSIGPLLIALVFSKRGDVDFIVFLFGILYFTSLAPLGYHLFLAILGKPAWAEIRSRIKELSSYALSRVPVRFVLASLFSLAPFLAPHFGSLQDAGFLIVGQMVLRLAELGSSAFGQVILPKAGELFSGQGQEYLKARIEDIIAFVFHIGLFITLHLILWSDQIILAWLGRQFVGAIPLMRVSILAVMPYLLFIMLSPIIDVTEEKPIKLKHLIGSFVVALFSCAAAGRFFSKIGLAFGTTIGLTSLGLFTVSFLWKAYGISFRSLEAKKILLGNLVLLSAGLIWKNVLPQEGVLLMGSKVFGEMLLLFLYLFILWKLQPRWMQELEKRLFTGLPKGRRFN